MQRFLTFLRLFLKKTQWKLFRVKLPVGVTALEKLSHDLMKVFNIPNLPSYHQAFAQMIMHHNPTSKDKYIRPDLINMFHVKHGIHKAMANQVAYEVIQRIKDEEKAKADVKEV